MRVLCVGRHAYLSEHLCRYFSTVGAECEPAVGAAEVLPMVARWEPEVVVADFDVLSPALLDAWAREPQMAVLPVLAVSMTRRPGETLPADLCGTAAVVYLPALDREQAAALLASVHRPTAVRSPYSWRVTQPAPSAHLF
jgi:chemotaxis response regulator CheB